MLKYIILCLCINLSCVFCDSYLNKTLGSKCEWEDLKGRCVMEWKCMTTLAWSSPPHPVCSTQGENKIVCCTDCGKINSTRNVVFSTVPMDSTKVILWKDGKGKARDNCLQYNKDLPYKCKEGDAYSAIQRVRAGKKKCSFLTRYAVDGAPPIGARPSAEYPYQALLGYGDDLKTAAWLAEGTLISDRYILTAAHVNYVDDKKLTYVALDLENNVFSPTWQTHKIKRFIPAPGYQHPYRYHDIALIETETPVQFDFGVLPACLHVVAVEEFKAVTTSWGDIESKDNSSATVNTIRTNYLLKLNEKICNAAYGHSVLLPKGMNITSQMCYAMQITNVCESFKVWLGLGRNLETATWAKEGELISDGYIVIAKNVSYDLIEDFARREGIDVLSSGWLKYVALGVKNHSDSWQTYEIRILNFFKPQQYAVYRILTDKPEIHNCYVLPNKDDEAVANSGRDLESKDNSATVDDTIQAGLFGQPLLVDNQFNRCVYAVIGVTSFRAKDQSVKPDVYTRVAHYMPWIESIVWP